MRWLALCLAAVTVAAPALAQTGAPKKPKPVSPPRVQVIDIEEGDLLEGVRLAPEGEVFTTTQGAKFESLIRVRSDFKDKIAASFDEL